MADEHRRKRYREWARAPFGTLPFPEECRDMTCGAKIRKGTLCKQTSLYGSGRCKLHGGMSTGAKTPEGKARQLEGYRRWQAKQHQTTSEPE
ncbi:HGGxSTG domain-containing protein [Kluyvera cryocrescens]|uniref:HGGxSTG domain-containing protein n=1 Tax=Kluyvera cryocrescens TaxID=580 RepID=UPI002B05E53D|nr:HGGxSTG domain-containing protein [Kluyvera cryocrescens]